MLNATRWRSRLTAGDGSTSSSPTPASPSWPETTWQATEEQWQTMIDVTLTGTLEHCRAAIPAMLDGGRGRCDRDRILVGGAQAGRDNRALRRRPKAGLVGLMKSLALELASVGVRVNTVHPGGTATEMTQNPAAEHWQATAPGWPERSSCRFRFTGWNPATSRPRSGGCAPTRPATSPGQRS